MEGGGEGEIGPELELEEEGGGVDLSDYILDNGSSSQCTSHFSTHGLLPPDVGLPQSTYSLPPDVALPHKRKMPKRKQKKFGKGATRGGDRKSGRFDTTVDRLAQGDAATAGDHISSDSAAVVKRLNKKQLQQRLDRNTKTLKSAERKVTSTQKKLLATKEHCKQLARLALERRKDA